MLNSKVMNNQLCYMHITLTSVPDQPYGREGPMASGVPKMRQKYFQRKIS